MPMTNQDLMCVKGNARKTVVSLKTLSGSYTRDCARSFHRVHLHLMKLTMASTTDRFREQPSGGQMRRDHDQDLMRLLVREEVVDIFDDEVVLQAQSNSKLEDAHSTAEMELFGGINAARRTGIVLRDLSENRLHLRFLIVC
ncbi:hypothetical protein VTO42DRAFT_3794 [Malbranchea cinnamomea]